jgi:hypothetical protein
MMQVMEVRNEPALEPNHVYGIPPERTIIIIQGVLQLLPRETSAVHRLVDQFFRAFARSGGTRPSAGSCPARLRQDATAPTEGMRHHLRLRGLRAPPAETAREIVRIGQHQYAVPEAAAPNRPGRATVPPRCAGLTN